MSSINKVILVGRLGADPDIKQSSGGNPWGTLSVATSERRRKGDSHEEKTEWHKVKVFGKTAEACGRYLHKGSQVYVEGKIETDVVEKDGQKRYYTSIVAWDVKFLGGRSGGESGGEGGGQHRTTHVGNDGGGWGDGGGGIDDDVPF